MLTPGMQVHSDFGLGQSRASHAHGSTMRADAATTGTGARPTVFNRSTKSARKRMTKSVYETSVTTIFRGMIDEFSDEHLPDAAARMVPVVQRMSLGDEYSTEGSKFRASMSGTELCNYTHGLNTDNLPQHMLRDYNAAEVEKKQSRVFQEEQQQKAAVLSAGRRARKAGATAHWNRSPHVEGLLENLQLPRLRLTNPLEKVFAIDTHQKKAKQRAKRQIKCAYSAAGAVQAKKYLGPKTIWIEAPAAKPAVHEKSPGKKKKYRKRAPKKASAFRPSLDSSTEGYEPHDDGTPHAEDQKDTTVRDFPEHGQQDSAQETKTEVVRELEPIAEPSSVDTAGTQDAADDDVAAATGTVEAEDTSTA